MKYVLIFAVALFLQTSCKKCATCTYSDPETDQVTSNEICNTGHLYDNEKTTYEKNGWVCAE